LAGAMALASMLVPAVPAWAANYPQQITKITKQPDGTIQLNCMGTPGGTYLIQAAATWQSPAWSTIGTNTAASDGTFTFVDTGAPNYPQRLYCTLLGSGPPTIFTNGFLAKGLITINGAQLLNSFFSSDTNYSTGGLYDPAKALDQIAVGSGSSAHPAVKVGNAKIHGYVQTGPSGTVSFGGGAVGDSAWISAGNAGAEAGHVGTNANTNIADVPVPFTGGAAPFTGVVSVNGTNYTSTLTSTTNYYAGNYTIAGGQSLVVTNNARLYVTGGFSTSGSGFLYLAPGASLKLYVGTTNLSGNNSIVFSGSSGVNGTGYAANFCVVGLASVKTVTVSGNKSFIGTVYAPEAAVTLTSIDSVGAVIGSTITLGGNFHYDGSVTNLTGL
jgi:hypothetical protein